MNSYLPLNTRWTPALQALQTRFPEHPVVMDPAEFLANIDHLDAIVSDPLDHDLLRKARQLKAVFVPFTGINHLPLPWLLEQNIKVYNIHGQAASVAQCALAMTLAFYGRVIEYHNALRETKWHGYWVGGGSKDNWHALFGRPAAIFGTGAIGVAMAKLLKAFDCSVVGYRRHMDGPLPPHFDRLESDLDKAIAEAELLFIALPLTAATEGLFSKAHLLTAHGKFLVNVGRGAIVDEESLYLALQEGVLKGAAIDTWYAYPHRGDRGAPSRYPIHQLPNVILSPHVAGCTRESSPIKMQETLDNIAQWLTTGKCSREVDLSAQY